MECVFQTQRGLHWKKKFKPSSLLESKSKTKMADKGMMPMEKMDSAKILGTFTFKPMDDVAWYVCFEEKNIFFSKTDLSLVLRSHSLS